ncbi:uncharacterized protein [Battus philenor]|uniref:uncharacterized protein n=1 Tax=Battus philenor TaxID=42288 RepID=UPI0035CFCE47
MPSRYTPQEYANMHLIYGECKCNASAAARLYRERYPNAERYPDHRVFVNVHRSLSNGLFPNELHSKGRPSVVSEDKLLEEVTRDPNSSVRGIAARIGITKSTAYRILKKYNLHPCKKIKGNIEDNEIEDVKVDLLQERKSSKRKSKGRIESRSPPTESKSNKWDTEKVDDTAEYQKGNIEDNEIEDVKVDLLQERKSSKGKSKGRIESRSPPTESKSNKWDTEKVDDTAEYKHAITESDSAAEETKVPK